jgi:hypothetical protein
MDEESLVITLAAAAIVLFAVVFGIGYADNVNQTNAIIRLVGDGADPLAAACAIRGR